MKKNLLFVSIIILLTACSSGISASDARRVATEAALGTPPAPKYQTAAAEYLGLVLTPTPQATSTTVTVIDYAGTMAAYEMLALMTRQAGQAGLEMTKQANDLALEREKLLAEQRAEAAKATAAAAERTAAAVDAIRTSQAQATSAMQTSQANATGTQQGLLFIQGTQAAHGVETQQAAGMTAAVEPTHAMWTVTAVYIQQRISEGQARDVELAVRRQEMKNVFDAFGPWLLVIFVAVVSRDGFIKWLKTRIFKRDEHGKKPIVALEKNDETTALVNTDLMTNPVMVIDRDGNVSVPKTADADEQAETRRGAQLIEAVSHLPTPYAQQGAKWMNGYFGQQVQAFEVLGNGRMPPAGLVDGEAMKSIEMDWKEGAR